ncbi:MAG: F0F1 ATP synthase subunit epsilon [Thermaerobacter sp.]|nr:F0F1 ATP synthase subunit epsilon [Thermaerobacter sp.]
MSTTHLRVITPERQVVDEDVEMVILRGTEGELGVLPQHAPLMTAVDPAPLRLKREGTWSLLAAGTGFLEVGPRHLTVLVDSCERPEEIDVQRARAARKRAEERLKAKREDVDYARAKAALQRAIARLKAAGYDE